MSPTRASLAVALAATLALASTAVFVARLLEPERVVALPSVPSEPIAQQTSSPGPEQPKYATSVECPEMNNPGGLRWEPAANPGPFPTNGSVHLPSLAVEAPIVRVGVGSDGMMVVPHNARDVAWLDQGGITEDTNNIVLAGHISYSRVPGSFFRLRELAKGDKITVEMDGRHHKFQVVWNCFFDRNTDQAAQIMGKTDVSSVTLISCGGVFDRSAGTHAQRIAVRAELVS